VFFADSIFGSTTVKLPPPNWCGIAGPKGCYGSVPSVLGRIIKDIYGLPSFPNRLTPGFGAETGWMLNFQDSANAGAAISDPRRVVIDKIIDAGKGAYSYPRGIIRAIEQLARRHGSKGPGQRVQATVIEDRLINEVLEIMLTFPSESVDVAWQVLSDRPAQASGRVLTGYAVTRNIRRSLSRILGPRTGAITGAGVGVSLTTLAVGGDVLHAVQEIARQNNIFITTVDPNKRLLPQLGEERAGVVFDSISGILEAAISGGP
jgi:hypothetical protein